MTPTHDIPTQTALALADYWQMRAQGLDPDKAAAHAKQRFGITIDRALMNADAASPRRLRKGDRVLDWAGDPATIVSDESDQGEVDIQWDDREFGDDGHAEGILVRDEARENFTLLVDEDDLLPPTEPMETLPTGEVPISLGFGSDFCRTIFAVGTDGRQGP